MTNKKDVSSSYYSDLSRISKAFDEQTSELRRAAQIVADTQNRLLANTSLTSSLNVFADTVNQAMAPTRALIANYLEATEGLRIKIAAIQNIGNIAVRLKSINSVTESKSDSSCLVSMSADIEEKHDTGSIIYKNCANVKMTAVISDIRNDQKEMLERLSSLEKKEASDSVPATITKIDFLDKERSIVEIDGKIIKFRGGIASDILYTIFGRKNFSKTRTYDLADFYEKVEGADWFELEKPLCRLFGNKVYQSVRNINNRFMEETKSGEKLILQSKRNSYIVNPKLFK